MTRLLRAAALALAIACVPGCLAPPIGLPPPDSLVASCSGGVITISGMANPGAYVSALNVQTDHGVIVRADPMTGAFTLMIAGIPGNNIEVWQEVGTERSAFNDLLACGSGSTTDH